MNGSPDEESPAEKQRQTDAANQMCGCFAVMGMAAIVAVVTWGVWLILNGWGWLI